MVGILAVARPCLATPAVAELYSVISSKLLGILLMGLMVQMLGRSGAVCCHAPKQVLAVSCAAPLVTALACCYCAGYLTDDIQTRSGLLLTAQKQSSR